jgi:hypothetical protein
MCMAFALLDGALLLNNSISQQLQRFPSSFAWDYAIRAPVGRVHFVTRANRLGGRDPCVTLAATVVDGKVRVVAATFLPLDIVRTSGVAVSPGTTIWMGGVDEIGATDLQHVLASVALIWTDKMHALARVRCNAITLGSINRGEQSPTGAVDSAWCDEQSFFLRKVLCAFVPFASAMRATLIKCRHGRAARAANLGHFVPSDRLGTRKVLK